MINKRELKNVIVEKILADYSLRAADIASCIELYYDAQKLRIMHSNKEHSEGTGHLAAFLNTWLGIGEDVLYGKLKDWLKSEDAPAESRWAYELDGIGPVLAAGLAAHIDPAKFVTISKLWKYAGTVEGFDRPMPGTKLCYNARLKGLCWKIATAFVKVSNKEGAVYGALYKQFKAEEVSKNEQGLLAEAAAKQLRTKAIKDEFTRERNKQGKLIDAHLHNRALRRVTKRFLADYWTIGREARGLEVSKPYVIEKLNHTHYQPPERKCA